MAGDLVVDAAVLEAGLQGEAGEAEGLFAVGEDDVAGLLADVEVAVRVAAVCQIPVGGEHEVVFDGGLEEVVQLGDVEAGRAAFAGEAVALVPHEAVHVEAAAHRRPLRRAEGDAFRARFEGEAVLQFEVEAAGEVEASDGARPAVVLVEAAVGQQVEGVVFAAHGHAAVGADAVAQAGADDGGVDAVDAGAVFAARHQPFAVHLQVERLAVIGGGGGFEVEFVEGKRVFQAQAARAAGEVGGEFFRVARDVAFGVERAGEAEAEFVEFGGGEVDVEAVARFAEAAVGFEAVASEQDVGGGAFEVFVSVLCLGTAGEGYAGEGAVGKAHLAAVAFFGQYAVEGEAAVDAALGQVGVQGGGVEAFAVDLRLEQAAAEQFERAGQVERAAAFGGDAGAGDKQGALAVFGVGGGFQTACALGVLVGDVPGGFGVEVAAGEADFAVEFVVVGGVEEVGGGDVVQFGGEVEGVAVGVHAAAEQDAAFVQQTGFDVLHGKHAFAVYGEFAQQTAHGDAVLVGGAGGGVDQIDRAFEGEAVLRRGNDGGVEIEFGGGRGGGEHAGVDAVAFDEDLADLFVEAVFKRADERVGVELHRAAGEFSGYGGAVEVAREGEAHAGGDVVEFGHAADAAPDGVGGGRLNAQHAAVRAPRGFEVFDEEGVGGMVVEIGGFGAVEDDAAFFAAADLADGEAVEDDGQGQVDGVGQFGGGVVFGRGGFGLDVDAARFEVADVQKAV